MALYGIYGSHTTESCPLNNVVTAQGVVQFAKSDVEQLLKKYKINKIIAQYHSALEHTFLWVVDAQDAHLVQQFCIESKISAFNAVKIVPLVTFDDVVTNLQKLHKI